MNHDALAHDIPVSAPRRRALVRRPLDARDDLALELAIADLRGDLERRTILIDALLGTLNEIELAAIELSQNLPPAARAELFEEVLAGLPAVINYELALVRLDLDDATIARAIKAAGGKPVFANLANDADALADAAV